MRKALRTTLGLVVSLALLSAMATAAPSGKNADKHKNNNKKEHHSVFSKLAFWRHHKNTAKNGKNHGASQHAQAKTTQKRTASAKPTGEKKDQKQQTSQKQQSSEKQQASHKSKASGKKAPAATKTKAEQSARDATTVIGP